MSVVRLTLAQMRRSAPRLVAAGIAIAIATAFVAATILTTAIVQQTARASASENYQRADVVVLSPDGYLTMAHLNDARSAEAGSTTSSEVAGGAYLSASDPATTPDTEAVNTEVRVEDPGFPADPTRSFSVGGPPKDERHVALEASAARRLGAHVGSEIWLQPADGTPVRLELSGVFTRTGATRGPLAITLPTPIADATATSQGGLLLSRIYVASPGGDAEALRAAVAANEPDDVLVRTRAEQTDADLEEFLGTIAVLLGFVAGFVAVALFVASLVITNTFQVMIASRTRILALERCLGATRSQVRASVLLEAGLLGLIAAIVGIVIGSGLTQVVLWFLTPRVSALVPSQITPTWLLFAAPLVIGIGVALLSALVPAHLATRVAPLAALRPQSEPLTATAGGRTRLALALSAIVLGAGILALALLASFSRRFEAHTLMLVVAGVVGAIILVAGFLLAAVFWLPRAVRVAGRLLGRPGGDARLAATNALRNPRRSSATAIALMVTVGLLAVVATGAQMTRSTLHASLADHFPIDMMVMVAPAADDDAAPGAESGSQHAIAPEAANQMGELPGVEHSAIVRSAELKVSAPGTDTGLTTRWVAGVDPADLGQVMAGPWSATLASGEAIAARHITAGGPNPLLRVEGDRGAWQGPAQATLPNSRDVLPDVLISASALAQTTSSAAITGIWLKLAPNADVAALTDRIRDLATTTSDVDGKVQVSNVQLWVMGAFETRQTYERVISAMLLVAFGLLAIAAVIALVGVANTLSLSIRERRRETAVLRALGLTRRRLRRQLAIEGMMIAGLGTISGLLLGTALGWAGASLLLTAVGTVVVDFPWVTLAIVAIGGTASGALASILPGRAAARTSPTASLTTE